MVDFFNRIGQKRTIRSAYEIRGDSLTPVFSTGRLAAGDVTHPFRSQHD